MYGIEDGRNEDIRDPSTKILPPYLLNTVIWV
jgi:hypothetical protein